MSSKDLTEGPLTDEEEQHKGKQKFMIHPVYESLTVKY